jgi:hypothetical protein
MVGLPSPGLLCLYVQCCVRTSLVSRCAVKVLELDRKENDMIPAGQPRYWRIGRYHSVPGRWASPLQMVGLDGLHQAAAQEGVDPLHPPGMPLPKSTDARIQSC